MLAYVQKQNNEWLNENCYSAQYGFNRMGYNVKSFEKTDVDYIDFIKADVVFGGINTLNFILETNKIEIPRVPLITEELKNSYKRNITISTIGDVRNDKIKYPFFVKPLDVYKLFTGTVFTSGFDIHKIPNLLSDDIKVLISEVVEFVSEYRCFVLDNKLVGCKNYTGDFTVLPDFDLIQYSIVNYKNSPSAYTLDFGITEYNNTELIEINDGYGFGAYGLNPIIFCKMIAKRWSDIINKKEEAV